MPASSSRLLLAALAAASLAACSSKSAPGDGAGGAMNLGGADGASDASHDVVARDGAPFVLAGPCVEGMECNGNDPGGSPAFQCVCTNGNWACPTHDSQGWLASDLPLPSADPVDTTPCTGTNYACTLPDRCGSLCVCTQTGKWACKTVTGDVGDGGGGPVIVEGTPDAGSASGADPGCAWPSCSVFGAAPPATAQCFTPVCFSTIYPSGDPFFAPGVGGCSVEH